MQTRSRFFLRLSLLSAAGFFASALPAGAHHAMGGRMPANGFEGFVSDLAHPVIGMDHLAMIVAVGLLSAVVRPGIFTAAAFVVATVAGTAIHLFGINIPGSEMLIAASVLAFGIFLAVKRTLGSAALLVLAGLVGVLHGYAYGESIFGAQPQPLIAYILGFACVQMLIATGAFALAGFFLRGTGETRTLRPAGLVLTGFGLALLSAQIVSAVFPG